MDEPLFSIITMRDVLIGEHDDSSGVIYFPAYFHFASMGDQELFKKLGRPLRTNEDIAAAVVSASCSYKRLVRSGDSLAHSVSLYLGRSSSMTTKHLFVLGSEEVAASVEIVRCWIDLRRGAKTAMPEWLADLRT